MDEDHHLVRVRMGNETRSVWLPEVSDMDEFAYQAFAVIVGIAFVMFVGVVLSYTVIANTLREVDDWAHRTSRAELQLSEATEYPTGTVRANRLVGEDEEEFADPPSHGNFV
jgi:hypothetical protein